MVNELFVVSVKQESSVIRF